MDLFPKGSDPELPAIGGDACRFKAVVSDLRAVRIFLAEVNQTMGRVEVLVHSAKMVFQRRECFAECGLARIRLRLYCCSRRFRLE